MMQFTNKYNSPLGGITLASDGESLTGVWFDGQKYFGYTLSPKTEDKQLPVFEKTKEWLDCYFGGGIQRKIKLLKLERANMDNLF